jgi:hypothetical protein
MIMHKQLEQLGVDFDNFNVYEVRVRKVHEGRDGSPLLEIRDLIHLNF